MALSRITGEYTPYKDKIEAREPYCTVCQDQKSYDVFVLPSGMRVAGYHNLLKQFGKFHHDSWSYSYRERCASCYGAWESKFIAKQEEVNACKKNNDHAGAGLATIELKKLMTNF
jgi:hypothetical protein